MAIPQGRNGFVTIGAVTYPVFNWQMPSPRNLVAPAPVGNSWTTHFAEGLQTTRFTAAIECREKSTEILALAFWNMWLSRTFSGGFDDTATETIVASNGRRSYTLANAKAEAFTLTIVKGMAVGLSVVYVAPGVPTMANVTPAAYAPVDGSPPLMFDRATFGGIAGNVYSAEVTYANNHLINAPLDGSKNAASWDAGGMSCGASFTFDARAVGAEPFADGSTLTISLTNGTNTRVLTLDKVTPNNPRDVGADPGQSFVTYNCLVQGDATNQPLVVA